MYYIQAKLNTTVLQEYNTVSEDIGITEYFKFWLSDKADMVEVYTHEGLLDTESIQLIEVIHLKEVV
jgi:hypothetical protein